MREPLFSKVPPTLDFPKEEREVLRFWKERRIFEKTLAKPAPKGPFIFYEGPPTANGAPHNGHVLTRVIKDLFPRYRTMRGYRVPRKAGWDTHGLPVEVEVEKELRLHGKAAIEQYGVEPFVKKCIESVFRYTREWEDLTERVAFWVDLGDAYVTYHRAYVESVWWALAELFNKDLLYQGHKVVWWWAQGGTALSAGEVGQGYRTVDDPSVYVAFPLVSDPGLALLVWTTTPWTLPSNMYAAVHPRLAYSVVRAQGGRRFVVASGLREALAKKLQVELSVERELPGAELVGVAYLPPFDLYAGAAEGFDAVLFRVISAEFVTLDAGTGIVHIAPAFGEDDHEAHRRVERAWAEGRTGERLPLFCAVEPDGTFVAGFERYAGRWVKDCDKEIVHDLSDRGVLVHSEVYRHDYPFCWRADRDPLIQYARPAWYIRTTARIDRALEDNATIRWLPAHIKDGRFGDFLANNVDWALSRERYWGTPLNVWVCEGDASHKEAMPSIASIEARNPLAFDHFRAARAADPSLSEHLIVHKPWVDYVTFPCAACGNTMRRVPEVIDVWLDSGCMPFAQWGYPHVPGSDQKFAQSFPADFISEAIDQTRGWFYSLLMVSTLVFESHPYPHPYKTCIVLGHVTDREGKKESKSKGNYTPPEVILDQVAMQFAVVESSMAEAGVALVAREDLEGLDLEPDARVLLSREGAADRAIPVAIRSQKGMRRRVVALHPTDRARLGVVPTSVPEIAPVLVPRLPAEERVVISDPTTPAPGADAFRWFFYASSPPWSATRHSLSNVRALQREFAVKLRNVYSFFTIYAGIDGFVPPASSSRGVAPRPELDRWIASELALAVRGVTTALDEYDAYGAAQKLIAFVDSLSNWWVRQSRARFWKPAYDDDKRSAYETLYSTLVTVAKLTAPFTPYAAEAMWQNLVVGPARANGGVAEESVHLADWPTYAEDQVDDVLVARVATVRALVSLGLQVRTQAKIRVRQPLSTAYVITARLTELLPEGEKQLSTELNVHATELVPLADARRFVAFRLKPNFRTLGQRGLGREAQALKKAMAALSPSQAAELALRVLEGEEVTAEGIVLGRDDVELEFLANEGFAAAGDRAGVVVLDTRIDDALRQEGLVREIVNRVQTMRKEAGFEYTDRIRVAIAGDAALTAVAQQHWSLLAPEVLAVGDRPEPSLPDEAFMREVEIEGMTGRMAIMKSDHFVEAVTGKKQETRL